MTKNKYIGTSFDDFLKEQGILEEVELAAIKMVIAKQVAAEMKKNHAATSYQKSRNKISLKTKKIY